MCQRAFGERSTNAGGCLRTNHLFAQSGNGKTRPRVRERGLFRGDWSPGADESGSLDKRANRPLCGAASGTALMFGPAPRGLFLASTGHDFWHIIGQIGTCELRQDRPGAVQLPTQSSAERAAHMRAFAAKPVMTIILSGRRVSN